MSRTWSMLPSRADRSRSAVVPSLRFSRTDRPPNTWRYSGTWAMPRCGRSAALTVARSRPSNEMRPAASGTTPEIALNKVVLPAPLGPTTAMNSPALTSMETSVSADRPPYLTVALSSLSIGHPLVAEIGLDHFRPPDHLAGRTDRDDLAMIEHHEAVDEFDHRMHGVFDDDDG